MFSIWRITSKKFKESAFSGEGARLFGGRWNSPGIPLIYTAESKSLVVLEILVHLESPELLRNFMLFEVKVEESLVADIDPALLPEDWRESPPPIAAQKIGNDWANNVRSVALRVPSAIVPGEFNFLLNPLHPDFGRLQVGRPQTFLLDSRLARRHDKPRTTRMDE